ncbi:hypothetical protein CEUSTIGMA_g7152.t1 [Chlamydomonas eustigma]|uniref:Rhodanese domain-containing protein n=1 Tax=Chlamydomonas eustigma TaxID=1157962 RepID=A0A250X9G3_9CHLO|nr:hypothetical protein CEUSTIGMA_g7152.t1 [Chlamydomonas eustigma]|eukprot:GAX79711.1 hypothetical protein CEUSTIGMA_g7152.t1 [Chlamydomonas eustigma]
MCTVFEITCLVMTKSSVPAPVRKCVRKFLIKILKDGNTFPSSTLLKECMNVKLIDDSEVNIPATCKQRKQAYKETLNKLTAKGILSMDETGVKMCKSKEKKLNKRSDDEVTNQEAVAEPCLVETLKATVKSPHNSKHLKQTMDKQQDQGDTNPVSNKSKALEQNLVRTPLLKGEKKKKRKGSTKEADDVNAVSAVPVEAQPVKKKKQESVQHVSTSEAAAVIVKQVEVSHGHDREGSKAAMTSDPGNGPASTYPPPTPRKGNVSILLFYAYCIPPMTKSGQDEAIAHCHGVLVRLKVTGRLRVGREGFNATLTGSRDAVRSFTDELRKFKPETFGETDFKIVDDQPDNHLLKGLKVWPVTEIVTYGFDPADAPLDMRGTHLKPADFHKAMADPDSVMIDVRNFNESLIGKFAPPPPQEAGAEKVLDPCMRRSTEFPKWVEENKHKLEGKKVLMYCTAGVRCERASAFMRKKGIQNVFQLEGGIHRYLDAYPEDGGFWVGKNYTFDKRYSHGPRVTKVVSSCVVCREPWDRYQAQKSCSKCSMEVLVCKTCQRSKPPVKDASLLCPLCEKPKIRSEITFSITVSFDAKEVC